MNSIVSYVKQFHFLPEVSIGDIDLYLCCSDNFDSCLEDEKNMMKLLLHERSKIHYVPQ